MPDRIEELEREVDRLRDLLLDNDIDPDPVAERYGPPTAAEANIGAMVNATLAAHAPKIFKSILKNNPLLQMLGKKEYDRAVLRHE